MFWTPLTFPLSIFMLLLDVIILSVNSSINCDTCGLFLNDFIVYNTLSVKSFRRKCCVICFYFDDWTITNVCITVCVFKEHQIDIKSELFFHSFYK